MSDVFQLDAQVRESRGRQAARRLRRVQEMVPAVVYGAGKEPQAITLAHKQVLRALENEAVYSHILTLKVDGKDEKVVLKALQRHPFKPKIEHIDFFRINANEKLTMKVPLHFLDEEEAPGVKAGGVVSHMMSDVEIRCLPGNLPEFIEVNVANLEMDHSVHLSDVKLPEGVELVLELDEEHNPGVVSIHMPRVEAEPVEEEAVAEGEEATEDEEGEKPASESEEPKPE